MRVTAIGEGQRQGAGSGSRAGPGLSFALHAQKHTRAITEGQTPNSIATLTCPALPPLPFAHSSTILAGLVRHCTNP